MAALKDIGCEDCGALFPMSIAKMRTDAPNTWFPGKKCPICGSEKFYPVIKTPEIEETEAKESIWATWKQNPWVGIGAAILVLIFIPLAIFLSRPKHEHGIRAIYMCEKCGYLFSASVRGAVPKKCPQCKNKSGYRARHCLKCHTIYFWKKTDGKTEKPECPKCKSTKAGIIENFEDVKKIKQLQKKTKPMVRNEGEINEIK